MTSNQSSNISPDNSFEEKQEPDGATSSPVPDVGMTRVISECPPIVFSVSTKVLQHLSNGSKQTVHKSKVVETPPPAVTSSRKQSNKEEATDKVKSSKIKSTDDASFKSRALVHIKNKVANSEVARLMKDYELSFLKTNDTRYLEQEPEWQMFGGSTDVHHGLGADSVDLGTPTCYSLCSDCHNDYCHEYLFGEYCIEAVKRYYRDHRYIATLLEAYITFETHYNRALDLYSVEQKKIMRCDRVKKTPRCMEVGSLTHALDWCKYHMQRNEHWCLVNQHRLITVGKSDPGKNDEHFD